MRLSLIITNMLGDSPVNGPKTRMVNSSLGTHLFRGDGCSILNAKIGSFCSIADMGRIGRSQDPMHFVSKSLAFLSYRGRVRAEFARHDFLDMSRIIISHDVWSRHGVVIGIEMIVKKGVLLYSIVVRNSALLISNRFSLEVFGEIFRSEWWNFNNSVVSSKPFPSKIVAS